MSSIIVRGLDESVKRELAATAKRKGRSMEAEARDILTKAVAPTNLAEAFLELGRSLGGVDEFEPPRRDDFARGADFE